MSGYGIEVFDGSGTVMTTITDRLTKVFGVYSVTITSSTTTNPIIISAPGVDASGSYFAIANSALFSISLGTNEVIVYWWYPTGTSYTEYITVFNY
jgi:hypothetical protein